MPARWMLLMLALLPVAAPAQSEAPLQAGNRVRFLLGDTRVAGDVIRADDAVLVLTSGQDEEMEVPISYVRRLEVSRGNRSSGEGIARGVLYGSAVGLVLGIAADQLIDDREPIRQCTEGLFGGQWCWQDRGYDSSVLVVQGVSLGVLFGAIVGALDPGPRWERVHPGDGVTVLAGRGTLGMVVRLPR
jgi:hypothetical protein